jgi:hypothetical protein
VNCSDILQAPYIGQYHGSTPGDRLTAHVAGEASRTLTSVVKEAGTRISYNIRLMLLTHGNCSQWVILVPVVSHMLCK